MSQFLKQAEFYDQVILLSGKERKDPFLVIERFFSDYRLHECRHYLWAMVEACLTTDNTGFSDPDERGGLLLRYKDLEELLEAAFLLLKHRPVHRPVRTVATPKPDSD
ncbi:hypothetical protein ACX0G9_07380 [Flavitalea flava]